MMRCVLAVVVLAMTGIGAAAQSGFPDLKGTWVSKGKAVVFGTHPHHPDGQSDQARVSDIETTHVVEGQDGALAWGKSRSAIAATNEPFAWAMSRDNRSIVGADKDGYFRITRISRNRMERCYVHNAVSPSGSIVATCQIMTRVKS
jgi:hypothetical protein